jgi:hypothetical protein
MNELTKIYSDELKENMKKKLEDAEKRKKGKSGTNSYHHQKYITVKILSVNF